MFGRKNKERKGGNAEMKEESSSKKAIEGCSGCSRGSAKSGAGPKTGSKKSK